MNQGSVAATVAKGSIVATDDGVAREVALKQEAESWKAPNDASSIPFASPKDIPVLDLARYCSAFESNAEGRSLAGALEKDASCHAADELKAARDEIAAALCDAGQRTGFCTIQGYDAFVSKELLEQSFAAAENFHSLTESDKLQYEMDDPSKVGDVGGVGYLREQNRKLPARTKANFNGSFIVKREHGPRNVTWDCMPWPHDSPKFDGARFRDTVTRTAAALERLALALLPVYAVALGLDADYFDASFESPLLRMRLSCYPHTPPGEFGINPHVNTSFFTLLATTDATGLVVFGHERREWLRARHIAGSMIINTGETLSRISNDTWPATRHYALNPASEGGLGRCRYSIPFFFNPSAWARMGVVPSCCDGGAKYVPISYLEGQGVAQGE